MIPKWETRNIKDNYKRNENRYSAEIWRWRVVLAKFIWRVKQTFLMRKINYKSTNKI